MAILFAVVAKGTTVLCSSSSGGGGDHENVFKRILPNITTHTDAKTTYNSPECNYSVHMVVSNGLIYACTTDMNFDKTRSYGFLDELKRQLSAQGLSSRVQFMGEGDLQSEFKHIMESEMRRFSNKSAASERISSLQEQVDSVKGVMTQNIEKVLERENKIEELLQKSTDLESNSATFRTATRNVSRKMWWKNTKMTILLIVVGVVVLIVIILIILFSTGVLPPKS